MCYERRRAEACVDESAHHALVSFSHTLFGRGATGTSSNWTACTLSDNRWQRRQVPLPNLQAERGGEQLPRAARRRGKTFGIAEGRQSKEAGEAPVRLPDGHVLVKELLEGIVGCERTSGRHSGYRTACSINRSASASPARARPHGALLPRARISQHDAMLSAAWHQREAATRRPAFSSYCESRCAGDLRAIGCGA